MTTETEEKVEQEQLNERTLQELFGELRRLAAEAGAEDLSAQLNQTEKAFKMGKLRVLLLGQFNHGKTLALNALLGQPNLLPVGATPTTALVTEINYGPENEVRLLDMLGRHKTLGLSEYRELAGNGTLEGGRYRRIEVTAPLPILKEFSFIDTPGLSDPDSYDPETLGPEISGADVIVFMLSAVQPLTATEQIFIKEKLTKKSQKRLIFLINQTDRLEEAADLPQVVTRVNSLLETLLPGAIALPFSAFEAAKGLQQETEQAKSIGPAKKKAATPAPENDLLTRSNYPGVKAALTTDLLIEKERLQEATLLGTLEEIADTLEERFEERRVAGQAELGNLSEARTQLNGERARLETVRARIQERSVAELRRMASSFIADVSAYTRRLSNELPGQIETAQQVAPNDISRTLPFYLEYALKSYMEARSEQFKDELRTYMQTVSEEIEQEFQQMLEKLDPDKAYFLTTLPRLRQKDTTFTWIARGITGIGAITIFLFGNIFVGALWLVASEVVRQAGGMRQQERGRLIEAGRSALSRAMEAVEKNLNDQFGDVERALGTELAQVFSRNYQALQDRLDELERQGNQSATERASEALATDRALSDLSAFKTRLAALSAQLIGPEVHLDAE